MSMKPPPQVFACQIAEDPTGRSSDNDRAELPAKLPGPAVQTRELTNNRPEGVTTVTYDHISLP